jgi:hypothetical protein
MEQENTSYLNFLSLTYEALIIHVTAEVANPKVLVTPMMLARMIGPGLLIIRLI